MAQIKLSVTTAVTALVMIGIVLTLTTFAALSTTQNVPSIGTVNTSASLGVYSDSTCNVTLSSINWGENLTPGTNITRTVYIKNTGSGLSLTLGMTASNLNPTSANGLITLTWNKENTKINPGQSVAATLTLAVSSSITDVTGFTVQINITGTNPN